jgi:predicted nucleic acid-binding protein
MRYCFDTSALNRLLDDPDHESLVCACLASGGFRITAFNVVEAAKTADVKRRTDLLTLFRRLSKGYRFLDRPNTILRATARGYAERTSHGVPSVTINADPNLDGLWVALNEPDKIDEETRAELLEWADQWERDFDDIVAGGRDGVQTRLQRVPEAARRPSETIRAYIRNKDQVFAELVGPMYERETGKALTMGEFDKLIVEPTWSLYLGGYAYGMHCRSVRMHRYSRKRVAGAFDLGQAVYLRFCDWFVTNDLAQYQALRFLNVLNTAARSEVLTYDTFRSRLFLPSSVSV